jgi:DNA-binding winged helix-turn-helix (wHTH) protein
MTSVVFGEFTLDLSRRQLLRGSQPLHLSPKAFELIAMLVEHRPAAVSKSAIHHRLWPDSFVSDGAVAVLIAEIRHALGDSARRSVFVRTIHRFGYAFAVSADTVDRAAGADSGTTMGWLTRGDQRVPVAAGENVVGRGPSATLRIGLDTAAALHGDPVGISRCHAVIVMTDQVSMLRDLASKNGTFVDGVRVTAPVRLADGAQIRLGSFCVQFRGLMEGSATQSLDLS